MSSSMILAQKVWTVVKMLNEDGPASTSALNKINSHRNSRQWRHNHHRSDSQLSLVPQAVQLPIPSKTLNARSDSDQKDA